MEDKVAECLSYLAQLQPESRNRLCICLALRRSALRKAQRHHQDYGRKEPCNPFHILHLRVSYDSVSMIPGVSLLSLFLSARYPRSPGTRALSPLMSGSEAASFSRSIQEVYR